MWFILYGGRFIRATINHTAQTFSPRPSLWRAYFSEFPHRHGLPTSYRGITLTYSTYRTSQPTPGTHTPQLPYSPQPFPQTSPQELLLHLRTITTLRTLPWIPLSHTHTIRHHRRIQHHESNHSPTSSSRYFPSNSRCTGILSQTRHLPRQRKSRQHTFWWIWKP